MKVFDSRTLYGQVMLFPALLLLVAVLLFAFAVWNHLREVHLEHVYTQGGRLLDRLIEEKGLNSYLLLDDRSNATEVLQLEIAKESAVKYMALSLEKDDAAIVVLPSGAFSEVQNDDRWTPLEGESYTRSPGPSPLDPTMEVFRLSKPVELFRRAGHIHLGFEMDSYREDVKSVNRRVVTTAILVFLLGLPPSLVLARRIAKPIGELTGLAEEFATGNLKARARVEGAEEILVLGGTMNDMASQLEEASVQQEQALRQESSLREKEILLKEIHHRVKNNMQVLSALMRMQARSSESEEVRSILLDSEARIRTIAGLHQRLYESENLSVVALSDYLEPLVKEIQRLYGGRIGHVEIVLNVEKDFALELDTALPVGLVVNELVTNSLKHAFPESAPGRIEIQVASNPDSDTFSLSVTDNGIGLPEGFSVSNSSSLGCRLVVMLAEQLEGRVEIDDSGPTRISLVDLKPSHYTDRT